jgi:hypothetical protein
MRIVLDHNGKGKKYNKRKANVGKINNRITQKYIDKR